VPLGKAVADQSYGATGQNPAGDTQLVLAAQTGDRAAFGALVERHGDALFRWLWHLTRRHELAEDLTQETLLRAFTRLSQFEAGTNFRGWLFRIGHNTHANWCRSRARRREEPLVPGNEGGLSERRTGSRATDPTAHLEEDDTREHLLALLDGMPADYRQALLMRVEGELSFKEIGEIAGVSEETARWRVFKGRRWLEERAREQGATGPA